MTTKLPLTTKYFPKTLKDIKKLPVKDLDKLISKYSLNGLTIFDEINNKKVNLLPNDVDSSTKSIKLTSAVKTFNNRNAVNDAITIFYHTTSALIDHNIYGRLADYIYDHYDIPKKMLKYTRKDDILHDAIKNGQLKGFIVKIKGFVGIDLYVSSSFNFTNSQLSEIASAYYSGDKKLIQKFSSDSILNKLHKDGHKFSKYIRPALPLLMKYPQEYRRGVEHDRLLYVISKYTRV